MYYNEIKVSQHLLQNGEKMTKIFDYFSNSEQQHWINKIKECDWSAAGFLAHILDRRQFHEVLGKGSLFIMADGDELVSFCTLSERDCVNDNTLFPWIGFVFTVPEYRGHRYSGKLIDFACGEAKKHNYDRVYLATDHIGLYEKYGFTYLETRTDIYDEESRIYIREL